MIAEQNFLIRQTSDYGHNSACAVDTFMWVNSTCTGNSAVEAECLQGGWFCAILDLFPSIVN